MKIQPFVDKLTNASAYKDFQKKYKDAYMVAGFFVMDFESGQNMHQIDYYVPSEKKIAAFTIDKGVNLQLLSVINEKVPEKLDAKAKIDLDALAGILGDEMKNRSITEEIRKIIAVLQTVEGRKVWSLNCVLSGMSILNAHIEDESETILKMEKKSILDYVKRMPMPDIKKAAAAEGVESSEDVNDKIKKLNELEAAIEEEKKELNASEKSSEKSNGKTPDKQQPESIKENISETAKETAKKSKKKK